MQNGRWYYLTARASSADWRHRQRQRAGRGCVLMCVQDRPEADRVQSYWPTAGRAIGELSVAVATIDLT